MGVDIAKAALAAGNGVVATARDPESVTLAVGEIAVPRWIGLVSR